MNQWPTLNEIRIVLPPEKVFQYIGIQYILY